MLPTSALYTTSSVRKDALQITGWRDRVRSQAYSHTLLVSIGLYLKGNDAYFVKFVSVCTCLITRVARVRMSVLKWME
jgi:hypothetical protein